eukprot:scaffold637_cov173-Skeletonema_marinoi.AAC.10
MSMGQAGDNFIDTIENLYVIWIPRSLRRNWLSSALRLANFIRRAGCGSFCEEVRRISTKGRLLRKTTGKRNCCEDQY